MKRAVLLLISVIACQAHADDGRKFSLGFGHSYGGLGMKYDFNISDSKLYLSLGSFGPIGAAYGVGWERVIHQSKHSVGVYLGALAGAENDVETTKYFGPAGTYRFYFSGYKNPSWVLGASAGFGYADNHEDHEESTTAVLFSVAYQF